MLFYTIFIHVSSVTNLSLGVGLHGMHMSLEKKKQFMAWETQKLLFFAFERKKNCFFYVYFRWENNSICNQSVVNFKKN